MLSVVLGFPFFAQAALRGHGGPVQAITIAPDGRFGLSGGFDYAVVYWDFQNAVALSRLIGHDGGVNAVAFVPSPDGAPVRAISGGDDGMVIVWDLPRREVVKKLNGHTQRVASVAVSPDGRLVASAAWDRSVRIWDLATGGMIYKFDAGDAKTSAVIFTLDGGRVAAATGKGEIREWDVVSGRATRRLKAHDFPINALAISADGKILASASVDKTIRLWRWPEAEEVALIELHDTAVLGLAISADGSLLASAGADGVINLWSIPEGKPIGALKGHSGAVWAVSFAPDGKRLYSAGRDEQIRIWDIASLTEIDPAGGRDIPQPEEVADMTLSEKRGQSQFRKCRICHSVSPAGENRAGPTLFKVIGRPVGNVPGYPYSQALQDAEFMWTEAKIMDLFLLGPQAITPGSKMPLQRLHTEEDIRDLLNYLRRVTGGSQIRAGR